MAYIKTPICDRCGEWGNAREEFARVVYTTKGGAERRMDLCATCEYSLKDWMSKPKREKQPTGTAKGTGK